VGGLGNCDGGGEGESICCRARQVEYMFVMAGCCRDVVIDGGERGGEANARRVKGLERDGCEESQVKAEGKSIVASFCRAVRCWVVLDELGEL
jgi:hypothetical protein